MRTDTNGQYFGFRGRSETGMAPSNGARRAMEGCTATTLVSGDRRRYVSTPFEPNHAVLRIYGRRGAYFRQESRANSGPSGREFLPQLSARRRVVGSGTFQVFSGESISMPLNAPELPLAAAETVRRYYRLVDRGDIDGIMALFAPTAE